MNGLFFSDDTMLKIYEDKGRYNIFNRIPQIIYSSLIPAVINVILKMLSLTEKNIIQIRQCQNEETAIIKSKEILKCLKVFLLLV